MNEPPAQDPSQPSFKPVPSSSPPLPEGATFDQPVDLFLPSSPNTNPATIPSQPVSPPTQTPPLAATPFSFTPQSGEVSLPAATSNSSSGEGGKKPLQFPAKLRFLLVGLVVLLIGGGGAFFFLQSRTSTEEETPIQSGPTSEVTATPQTAPVSLIIETPAEGIVVQSDKLPVSGKAGANNTVAFFTDASEDTITTGVNGNFQGTMTLVSGINEVGFLAVSPGGQEKREVRRVTYEATGSALIGQGPVASDSAQKKAVHGVITGINGNSITLLEKPDTFYTISATASAEAKVKGVTPASLSSLKLAQQILAVGDVDQDGNLFAKLIHVLGK